MYKVAGMAEKEERKKLVGILLTQLKTNKGKLANTNTNTDTSHKIGDGRSKSPKAAPNLKIGDGRSKSPTPRKQAPSPSDKKTSTKKKAKKVKKKKKKKKKTKKGKKKKKKAKKGKKKKVAKAINTIGKIASQVLETVIKPNKRMAEQHRQDIDTTGVELEMDEVLMPKSTRIFLERSMVASTILLLLASVYDALYLSHLHLFLSPFDCIFSGESTQSYKQLYFWIFGFYFLLTLVRIYVQVTVLESENEEMNMGQAGGKLLAITLLNTAAIVALIVLVARVSSMLTKLVTSNNLQTPFEGYTHADKAKCRLQIDLFQRNYQCCGLNSSQEFLNGQFKLIDSAWSSVLAATQAELGHTLRAVVPASCCKPSLSHFCPFIALSSASLGNDTSSFFDQGCNTAIGAKLGRIIFNVEQLVLLKLAAELLLSLVHRLTSVSYTSNYELGHTPSITRVPYFFVLLFLAVWLLVFSYACHYVRLNQFFTFRQP